MAKDVYGAIEAEIGRLEKLVGDLAKAGDESAHAEADYKTAFSQARLAVRAELMDTRPTVDAVESMATIRCSDQLLRHLIATNQLTTRREALRASQARLDGLRSLAAGYRV